MNIEEAITEAWTLVKNIMHSDRVIIGLGSGTTIVPFIEAHPHIPGAIYIPTSLQSKALLDRLGLQCGDLNSHPQIDVTVDGCDAFDDDRNMIKGGGGCLLQEKMVAQASALLIILARESKKVPELPAKPIPIEVHPFAIQSVIKQISGSFGVTLRQGTGKLGPVMTDSGNVLLDVIARDGIHKDITQINDELLSISGILETGLFLKMNPKILSFQ